MPQRFVKDWTQLVPFAGATDLKTRISASLALITSWNAALSGHFFLADVLSVIARQAGAYNIAVYRFDQKKAWPIASAVHEGETRSPEISSGNLCRFLFETRKSELTRGASFHLSRLRKEPAFHASAACHEWDARPDITEVILLILETTDRSVDVIEFVYVVPPVTHPDLPREIIRQAMANAWELRSPGLMTCLIRDFGRARGTNNSQVNSPILSTDNPCGLSRAEQRVCKMLVDGFNAGGIAEALGLSMPTVRSHLRNIYAKTETSGQVELLAVINGRNNPLS